MSNTKSELFEKHPEWILQCKNRPLSTGRGGTQIVLDLTNPEVQDFVFSVIDNLMTQYPEIAYMKWDANSCMLDYGSPYSPKEKQSHLYIEQTTFWNESVPNIRNLYFKLVLEVEAASTMVYCLISMSSGRVTIQMHYNVSICNGAFPAFIRLLPWLPM